MAAGLPDHALAPYGRDPTSIAFLRTPGIERLYSGVANSTASARLIRFLKVHPGRGRSGLVVLIVERQFADLDDLYLHRGRRQHVERPHQAPREGIAAQAADDCCDIKRLFHANLPGKDAKRLPS